MAANLANNTFRPRHGVTLRSHVAPVSAPGRRGVRAASVNKNGIKPGIQHGKCRSSFSPRANWTMSVLKRSSQRTDGIRTRAANDKSTVMGIEKRTIARLMSEFVGTFLLTLVVATAPAAAPTRGLAISTMLGVLVYSLGGVSGSNVNPAVSLIAYITKNLEGKFFFLYVIAQTLGAFAAAAFAQTLLPSGSLLYPAIGAGVELGQAFMGEVIGTFILCYVIAQTALAKGALPNAYFGAAIGGALFAGAHIAGPISGGGFNPALSLGLITVVGQAQKNALAMYMIAPMLGAIAAALTFWLTAPQDLDRDFEPLDQAPVKELKEAAKKFVD